MKIIITIITLLLSYNSLADVSPDITMDKVKSAQLRNYPGGKDETSIKVQPDLVKPTQKIQKSSVHKEVLNNLLKEEEKQPEAN